MALPLLDVDAGGMPKIDFRNMRAGSVAARDEGCTLGFDSLQRKDCVPAPLDAGGVALGSDNDKIVVHHGIALHAKPFRNKFLLGLLRMHEYYIRIAAPRGIESLASALRQNPHCDSSLLFEDRQ